MCSFLEAFNSPSKLGSTMEPEISGLALRELRIVLAVELADVCKLCAASASCRRLREICPSVCFEPLALCEPPISLDEVYKASSMDAFRRLSCRTIRLCAALLRRDRELLKVSVILCFGCYCLIHMHCMQHSLQP